MTCVLRAAEAKFTVYYISLTCLYIIHNIYQKTKVTKFLMYLFNNHKKSIWIPIRITISRSHVTPTFDDLQFMSPIIGCITVLIYNMVHILRMYVMVYNLSHFSVIPVSIFENTTNSFPHISVHDQFITCGPRHHNFEKSGLLWL